MSRNSIQLLRFLLGFSWIYHGFFPKLWAVAPLEQQITATLGFSIEVSNLITKFAGVSEIIFGVVLIVMYKNRTVLLLSIFSLFFLCLFVAVQIPVILIEAFNPVTTNFALIGLSYVLLDNQRIKGK